jgi:hypothetical protein
MSDSVGRFLTMWGVFVVIGAFVFMVRGMVRSRRMREEAKARASAELDEEVPF